MGWTNYTFTILSAELSTKSKEENRLRQIELEKILENKRVKFKQMSGMYKGVAENSIMVGDITLGRKLANKFNQESVLEVYKQKNGVYIAYLYYLGTNTEEYLGEFTELPLLGLSSRESYTIDKTTYNIYGIR